MNEIKKSLEKQSSIRAYRYIASLLPSRIRRIALYNIVKYALTEMGVNSKLILTIILFILL